MFWYFSKMAPTAYSLTVRIDVTKLLLSCKEAEIKFFPAYLWLVTRNLNRQIEFKCAMKEGVLGYFDTLTPLYAAFHEDDHNFSLMWTEFSEDFSTFYDWYRRNQEQYGDQHGVLAQPQTPPPPNAYTVSAVPWIPFEHFAVHNFENKDYFFPSIEAGKFEERDGKVWMPLSMTCHHATTDGWHIHRFLEDLQRDMDRFPFLGK